MHHQIQTFVKRCIWIHQNDSSSENCRQFMWSAKNCGRWTCFRNNLVSVSLNVVYFKNVFIFLAYSDVKLLFFQLPKCRKQEPCAQYFTNIVNGKRTNDFVARFNLCSCRRRHYCGLDLLKNTNDNLVGLEDIPFDLHVCSAWRC